MVRERRLPRRVLLGAAGALTACATVPGPAAPAEPASAPPALPGAPPQVPAEPAPVPAPPMAIQPSVPPPPVPALLDLGVDGVVQPVWSGDGERVLFYDQPQPSLGGSWSVDAATGQLTRERPQWGYYVGRGTLLVTPRPAQRDSAVIHLPSGREWTLPTTNSTLFSWDGTLVAYGAAAQTGGGGGGPGNFQTSTLVVSGADGQDARRLPLPLNASPVAWLPGRDGSPNGRILLTGRRSRQDHPALWVLDVRDRSLSDLVRSRRLVGVLPSPGGEWVAFLAMWNADPAQDGLWVMRNDGSDRRRVDLLGSYRWTEDGRLLVLPFRTTGESHEVWEVTAVSGEVRRLTDPAQTAFRVSNFDWDLSPDGTRLVFVSADTHRLMQLTLPRGLRPAPATLPTPPAAPGAAGGGKPYRLPFASPPGASAWYVAQWYGVTTGGYRGRNTGYSQGQGIHFGIDFAAPMGTPVVAMASGRVVAVDGDYGSPPHNVVVQFADGNQAMYGHLAERSRHVQVGQAVEAGQVVGNTGDSGAPYDGFGNPHLHLEIRKGGRAVATNPLPYVATQWDDLSLGTYPGPRFERNLDDPKRHQFPEDQPDIRFGGAIITNFARPWPP